jgi:DNA-binding transcriptional regulator PaaX
MHYKGYKVGSLEKGFLKLILNVKDTELPSKYSDSFSDIFQTIRQKTEYPNTIKRMVKKGLLKFISKDGEVSVILTSKGKDTAQRYLWQDYKIIKRSSNWDGKWRLVMFDIPEKRKRTRDLIRFQLKKIGFVQVQGSVWIYPYSCEEIVTMVKTYFNLNDEIIYLITESFEKDHRFRKHFKLI